MNTVLCKTLLYTDIILGNHSVKEQRSWHITRNSASGDLLSWPNEEWHNLQSDGLVEIAIKSFSLKIHPQFGSYLLVTNVGSYGSLSTRSLN